MVLGGTLLPNTSRLIESLLSLFFMLKQPKEFYIAPNFPDIINTNGTWRNGKRTSHRLNHKHANGREFLRRRACYIYILKHGKENPVSWMGIALAGMVRDCCHYTDWYFFRFPFFLFFPGSYWISLNGNGVHLLDWRHCYHVLARSLISALRPAHLPSISLNNWKVRPTKRGNVILAKVSFFTTLWKGDADLRLCITTVEDGWRTSAFFNTRLVSTHYTL